MNKFMLHALALACLFAATGAISFNNAYIQNVKSGRCITITKDVRLNPLVAENCECGAYQFWRMENGEKVINELAFFPYMDELYGKKPNGETVGIYSLTAKPWQKWDVRELKDGAYTFVVRHTGKCLHQSSGGRIDQYDCDNNDQSQQWKIIEDPCGKPPRLPSGTFQLQNIETGKCAVVLDNSDRAWAKIGTQTCSCSNKYHYWKLRGTRLLVTEGRTKMCMANWEPGHPGVTQCGCVDDAIHRWRFNPTEDGVFQLVTQVSGKCVKVNGAGDPVGYTQCNTGDAKQKWRFYDECNPEPRPTPKPTPPPTPPPTPAPPTQPPTTVPPTTVPPTLPPQPKNEIPSHLTYFFENGQMNWLTPERYTLLFGGRWDSTTLTWYTIDGREVRPNTETWKIYFGNAQPSFLSVLFQNKNTWNQAFGWMTIEFFQKWTSWKIVVPPQPKDQIPTDLVPTFTNGQMNWLTPEKYTLLFGGRWDPVTLTWYTIDGRDVRPNTETWKIYFGNAQPSLVSVLFQNKKTWNEVFGWMTTAFFQKWTSWKTVVTPPQPKDQIPTDLVTTFTNGQMNWLTPERYTLLSGGRWDPITYTWYTIDGREVRPNTETWKIYFGNAQPSLVSVIFQNKKTWNETFGWMTVEFFQKWTSWKTVVTPQPKDQIPSNQVTIFTNGQMNWLTPERYTLLIGGSWDPVTLIWRTSDGRQIRPSTAEWTTYFGDLQPSRLNVLFPSGGSWESRFGWITSTFFQQWTGWKQTKVTRHISIVIPSNVPKATRNLFATGRYNWLTPDRIKSLAGGQWTGSEYITRLNLHVTPSSPSWKDFFGYADSYTVNELFGGAGYWDSSFSWLTQTVSNVPAGSSSDSFPWDSSFTQVL